MFLTERKLEARIHELERYRYRDSIPVKEFAAMEDDGQIGRRPPQAAGEGRLAAGQTWRGRDLYVWLLAELDIPAEWAGKKALGRFDFGRTGGGNNSGFESLLYLNGEPYQGVDSNHKEVFLPEGAPGQKLSFAFRLWSGLEGGGLPAEQEHKIQLAEICWLDESVDDLYFWARAAIETVRQLEESRPERAQVLRLLDRSFRLIDWSKPGSAEFYESAAAARSRFLDELDKIEKHHPVTVHAIGHTHIDVAWLWRLKHTREKSARSFSTVLRLMEQFPEYVFLQTQPQLYDYIKNDYPDIYKKIKASVAEGRWEAGGGMWLEADCNLTSGESLVRQLLFGTRFFRDEFGVECRYLWLPDVFGYSWALPQILRKSGFETFMTTKISWNQYNRMPHDTFRWRGIDGTEVLTHFITTPEPWSQPGSWFYTYNGFISAKTVKGIWDAYRDKELNQELLLSYGYGDGGGGVNREMLEMRRRLDKMPGIPHIKTGNAGDFFDKLHENVEASGGYVHTWDGELYLEYHRGTYTSQAYNKRMNRKLELLYREAEWLGVLSAVQSGGWGAYAQRQLNEGWKIILRNQFHDIIPGSSIHEVYEDSREEYAEAERLGRGAWTDAALSVRKADAANRFTVFNSAPWERTELLEIELNETADGAWYGPEGEKLRAERAGSRYLVQSPYVPPMGYAVIRFARGEAAEQAQGAFQVSENGIVTPFYEIGWNAAGQIDRLYDREAHRSVLAPGARGNVLQVFEDKPLAHDAWDIDLFYQEKMEEVTDLRSVSVKEAGSRRAVIRFEWTYRDSTFVQDMVLYADSRRIDFRTEADWQDRHKLLKTAFPVAIRATEATYDIQFGNVKRPTHWNTSWDYARFETVGHQWADLSERGYGVSLLNDCKYGYDVKDNVLRLSLLKAAEYPDPNADRGRHEFTYALLPHNGDWAEGGTVQEAWALNQPLVPAAGEAAEPAWSMFRLSSGHVMIDAVKKAEDGDDIIVRVHEFTGERGGCSLEAGMPVASWQECDLMERPLGERHTGGSIRFDIAPYEIRTFRIRL